MGNIIVLATDMAATSITLDFAQHVIITGKVKRPRSDSMGGTFLEKRSVTAWEAEQMAGRTARNCDGLVTYFDDPDTLTNEGDEPILDEVVQLAVATRIAGQKIPNNELIEPLPDDLVLTAEWGLTNIPRAEVAEAFFKYPVSFRLARFIQGAKKIGLGAEAAVIASLLQHGCCEDVKDCDLERLIHHFFQYQELQEEERKAWSEETGLKCMEAATQTWTLMPRDAQEAVGAVEEAPFSDKWESLTVLLAKEMGRGHLAINVEGKYWIAGFETNFVHKADALYVFNPRSKAPLFLPMDEFMLDEAGISWSSVCAIAGDSTTERFSCDLHWMFLEQGVLLLQKVKGGRKARGLSAVVAQLPRCIDKLIVVANGNDIRSCTGDNLPEDVRADLQGLCGAIRDLGVTCIVIAGSGSLYEDLGERYAKNMIQMQKCIVQEGITLNDGLGQLSEAFLEDAMHFDPSALTIVFYAMRSWFRKAQKPPSRKGGSEITRCNGILRCSVYNGTNPYNEGKRVLQMLPVLPFAPVQIEHHLWRVLHSKSWRDGCKEYTTTPTTGQSSSIHIKFLRNDREFTLTNVITMTNGKIWWSDKWFLSERSDTDHVQWISAVPDRPNFSWSSIADKEAAVKIPATVWRASPAVKKPLCGSQRAPTEAEVQPLAPTSPPPSVPPPIKPSTIVFYKHGGETKPGTLENWEDAKCTVARVRCLLSQKQIRVQAEHVMKAL